MVSFRSLTALLAIGAVTATAQPTFARRAPAGLERRQVTCLLNPAVTGAVNCIVAAAADDTTLEELTGAVAGCIAGLTGNALVR